MDKSTVLIVDDEPANRFLLEGLLNANGYEVLEAESGRQCLDILNAEKPDLILLDIMMPKMTGIEVLDELNKSQELKRIPVLMVSAKTATTDIQEALDKGAIDYIRKPFDEMELLARIKVGIRLKRNEDHLHDLIGQKDDFVQIISHDLRSPFAAINGFAELLLKDENLTVDQKESLNYIIESVTYSNEYFNKLLSWTMLEFHDLELSISEINIAGLIDNIFRILVKKADEKNLSLINDVSKNLTIEADVTFFRQVIINIINNAIKFTQINGTVRCYNAEGDHSLEIIISDNGVGIPENLSPEVLFSGKLNKSQRGTKGEKGTGIGLTICKKILDAHKFGITFRRKKDKGTDFVITINS